MILPFEKLLEKIDNPFQIVIVAARRARQLNSGAPRITGEKTVKNTTAALCEIMEGRIFYSEAAKEEQEKEPEQKGKGEN